MSDADYFSQLGIRVAAMSAPVPIVPQPIRYSMPDVEPTKAPMTGPVIQSDHSMPEKPRGHELAPTPTPSTLQAKGSQNELVASPKLDMPAKFSLEHEPSVPNPSAKPQLVSPNSAPDSPNALPIEDIPQQVTADLVQALREPDITPPMTEVTAPAQPTAPTQEPTQAAAEPSEPVEKSAQDYIADFEDYIQALNIPDDIPQSAMPPDIQPPAPAMPAPAPPGQVKGHETTLEIGEIIVQVAGPANPVRTHRPAAAPRRSPPRAGLVRRGLSGLRPL